MYTLDTPLVSDVAWDSVTQCNVVHTYEAAVVELINTCYTRRTNSVQTSILVGWVLRCPVFLFVGVEFYSNLQKQVTSLTRDKDEALAANAAQEAVIHDLNKARERLATELLLMQTNVEQIEKKQSDLLRQHDKDTKVLRASYQKKARSTETEIIIPADEYRELSRSHIQLLNDSYDQLFAQESSNEHS